MEHRDTLDPRQTLLCPYCWQPFDKSEVRWTAENPEGERVDTTSPYAKPEPFPRRLLSRLLNRFGPSAKPLPRIEPRRTALCPACGEALPDAFEYSRPVIIGLIGGPSSGKTHFLTALIHLLHDEMALEADGCTRFVPVGDTDRRYRTTFDALFHGHDRLGFTAPLTKEEKLNRPLIYDMTIEKDDVPTTYTVLFFDASGEQLEDESTVDQYHRYAYYADALILFADPWKMSKVIPWLGHDLEPNAPPPMTQPAQSTTPNDAPVPPKLPLDGTPVVPKSRDTAEKVRKEWRIASGGPPDSSSNSSSGGNSALLRREIWSETVRVDGPSGGGAARRGDSAPMRFPHQLIQEFAGWYLVRHKHKADEKIDLPVVLVIPKADELHYVKPVATAIDALIPPFQVGDVPDPVDRQRHYLIELLETSEGVRGILEKIAEPALLVALKQFTNKTYHAVSATGCGLNQQGKYPFVRPQRVVEPLVSLLMRLNVLGNG